MSTPGDKTCTGYLGIDGTLILRLRREEEGCRFEDEPSYAPTSPHYESIRRYIGPVKTNSVFSVRPFLTNSPLI